MALEAQSRSPRQRLIRLARTIPLLILKTLKWMVWWWRLEKCGIWPTLVGWSWLKLNQRIHPNTPMGQPMKHMSKETGKTLCIVGVLWTFWSVRVGSADTLCNFILRNTAKWGLIPSLKREQTPPAEVSFQGLVWVWKCTFTNSILVTTSHTRTIFLL